MKADFRHFPVYTGIARRQKAAADIAESLAEYIYQRVPGLPAHVLAEKIYSSQGEVEITDTEKELLRNVAEQLPGVFCDSIKDYFKTEKK